METISEKLWSLVIELFTFTLQIPIFLIGGIIAMAVLVGTVFTIVWISSKVVKWIEKLLEEG